MSAAVASRRFVLCSVDSCKMIVEVPADKPVKPPAGWKMRKVRGHLRLVCRSCVNSRRLKAERTLPSKLCSICGEAYMPLRKAQHTCGRRKCVDAHHLAHMRARSRASLLWVESPPGVWTADSWQIRREDRGYTVTHDGKLITKTPYRSIRSAKQGAGYRSGREEK